MSSACSAIVVCFAVISHLTHPHNLLQLVQMWLK